MEFLTPTREPLRGNHLTMSLNQKNLFLEEEDGDHHHLSQLKTTTNGNCTITDHNGGGDNLSQTLSCDNCNEIQTELTDDNSVNMDSTRLRSYLRIRPVSEIAGKENTTFRVIEQHKLLATAPPNSQTFKNVKGRRHGHCRSFTFDDIFNETADQQHVYDVSVRPLVDYFLVGENALLFAYGVTSSGKSFTVRGNHKDPGMIPRAIHQVFSQIQGQILDRPLVKRNKFDEHIQASEAEIKQELAVREFILEQVNDRIDKSSNYSSFYSNMSSIESALISESFDQPEKVKYVAWISFLELYNDTLRDLLAVTISDEKTLPLKLMRDSGDNYFVSGLRHVFATGAEDAHKILLFGLDNLRKHVSATGMNKNSSRSHAIFTITLIRMEELKKGHSYEVVNVSNLSLSDLAGRERAVKTGSVGIRMQEANRINVSLLVLNHCIQSLRRNQKTSSGNQQIVPFANSNLTKVFKPFLTGQGITAMIININPLPDHFDETLASLEFSATASEIVIIKPEPKKEIRESIRRLTQTWVDSNKKQRKNHENGNNNEQDLSCVLASQLQDSILKNATLLSEELEMDELDYYKQIVQQLQSQLQDLQGDDVARSVEITKKMMDLDARLRKEFTEQNEIDIQRVQNVMTEKIAWLEEEHRLLASERLNRIDELQDILFEREEENNELREHMKDLELKSQVQLLMQKLVFEVDTQCQLQCLTEQLEAKVKRPTLIDSNTSVTGLNDKWIQNISIQTDLIRDNVDKAINTSILKTTEFGTDPATLMMVDRNTSICFQNDDQPMMIDADTETTMLNRNVQDRSMNTTSVMCNQNHLQKQDHACSPIRLQEDEEKEKEEKANIKSLEEIIKDLENELAKTKSEVAAVASASTPAAINKNRNVTIVGSDLKNAAISPVRFSPTNKFTIFAPNSLCYKLKREEKSNPEKASEDYVQQYLKIVSNDISPKPSTAKKISTTDKKTATNVKKSRSRKRLDLEPVVENKANECEKDDLADLLEECEPETKKIKYTKSKSKKTMKQDSESIVDKVTSSTRKTIGNKLSNSFMMENDTIVPPPQATGPRTGRNLRSRRQVNYKDLC